MKNGTCTCLFFCLAMVAVAASSLIAQTTSPSLAKELVATWDRATKDIIDVAEAMPEERYEFKPTPEMSTFGDQLAHVIMLVQRSIDAAKGVKSEAAQPHKTMQKAELVSHLTQTLQTGRELIASLTDAQVVEPVKPVRGDQMVTRYGFWMGPLYQVRNHHGQLVVYLRLNGIVPPTTARRPG
jgi:uncharacterized damage-inducible protein DinB